MDIPLTDAAAHDAIVAGESVGSPRSAAFQKANLEWTLVPDADSREPAGATLSLGTPFHDLFFGSANAAAQYHNVDGALVDALRNVRVLTIRAILSSDNIGDNDQARIVIRQAGSIIQPARNLVQHSTPTQVYWQNIDAEFDITKIDFSKPFSVILANGYIEDNGRPAVTEIHYTVDPTKVR